MAAPTSIVGTVSSGILGAYGSLVSAGANAAMYNYKAGMALINKQVADQNAQWDIQSGGVAAEEKGLQGAQAIGATKVAQSGSGVDVNSGTAAVVRQNQTSSVGYDQSIIQWNASKKAYGQEVQAAGDTAEATIDKTAASNAITAGNIGALSSILGASSSVASKWSQANTLGMGFGSDSSGGDMDGAIAAAGDAA